MSRSSVTRLVVAVVCIIIICRAAALAERSAPEVSPPPVPENFHLYLLIGQSNMAGRAPIEPQDRTPDLRVLMLDAQGRWLPAVDPVHADKAIAGVGLCRSFARTLAERDESITIGLIPCAVGGSSLRDWRQGAPLYEHAMARTKQAMSKGTLQGILWHQGETDARSRRDAAVYGERLVALITNIRIDLGFSDVPFVVGKLGEFTVRNPRYFFASAVNQALEEISSHLPNTACVDSAGLGHVGDRVHFSREGLQVLGRRYAESIVDLRRRELDSEPITDP